MIVDFLCRLFFLLMINSSIQIALVNLAYGQELTDIKIYYNNYDTGEASVFIKYIHCILNIKVYQLINGVCLFFADYSNIIVTEFWKINHLGAFDT